MKRKLLLLATLFGICIQCLASRPAPSSSFPVGLAAASSQTIATCRYLCRNDSSGKIINWAAQTTQNACCSGNVSCPAGYSFDTVISWNGGVCP